MQDTIRASIQGFVKIIDSDTNEVLVDTHNDVLYGNMSAALAHALIGNPNSFLYYMAFGNGGAYVGPTGTISYKPSLGGAGSLIKNPTANLYNTIYVKKLSNDATAAPDYNQLSKAYIPTENYAVNYEDITVDVTIGYTEPPIGITSSSTIRQVAIDNSTFVGTSITTNTGTASTFDPNTLVFNEIGLFAGSDNLFAGNFTSTITDVDNFITQAPNFSNIAGTKSKLMLTHVIFHPVQKSANRSLEIIYTLRIQMGVCSTNMVSSPGPIAVDNSYFTGPDIPVVDSVATNDIPSPAGGNVWSIVADPVNGDLVLDPGFSTNGSFTYTPNISDGYDLFVYKITDINGLTSTAVVTIRTEGV